MKNNAAILTQEHLPSLTRDAHEKSRCNVHNSRKEVNCKNVFELCLYSNNIKLSSSSKYNSKIVLLIDLIPANPSASLRAVQIAKLVLPSSTP
jgi:hypothetical protein